MTIFHKLNNIKKNHELEIDNFSKSIIEDTFKKVIELLNSTLSVKLPGFIIRGMTPYFNDGEECTHSSDFALPEINITERGIPVEGYHLLERWDTFKMLFSDYEFYKSGNISDVYDYANEIKSGNLQPINIYPTIEEIEIAEHAVSVIEKIIEKLMITNYIAVAKLKSDGTYDFTYKHFEPDY